MRISVQSLAFRAVRRSCVVTVGGLLLALALPIQRAAAQQGEEQGRDSVYVGGASLPTTGGEWTPNDPPRRFPPTAGPRMPNPLLPPMRSKPFPTIHRDRLSCSQLVAVNTVVGTGMGAIMGAVLFIPLILTRGDRMAVGTFKTLTIAGGVLGLVGSSQETACRPSAERA